MFLGEIIKSERLKRNLTQTELSNGICTQFTISRIEVQNTPPAVDILIEICKKLNLTLNDVFTDFSDFEYEEPKNNLQSILKKAELKLLKNNFDEASSILEKYNLEISNKNIPPILYLWKSYINLYLDKSVDETLLYLTTFSEKNLNKNDYSTLLFYNLFGTYYRKMNNSQLEKFFFKKSLNFLSNQNQYTNENIYRLLFSVLLTADFYLRSSNIETAKKVLSIGVNFLQESMDPYFAEKIINLKFSLAKKNDADYNFLAAASLTFSYLAK